MSENYWLLTPNEWGDFIGGIIGAIASTITLFIIIYQGMSSKKKSNKINSITEFSLLINQKNAVVNALKITEREKHFQGVSAIDFILRNEFPIHNYKAELDQLEACFNIIEEHLKGVPKESLNYCRALFESSTSELEKEILKLHINSKTIEK